MEPDPDIVDRMERLNPAKLLPFTRRWEPELPKKDRLPASFKGSMSTSIFDVSGPAAM